MGWTSDSSEDWIIRAMHQSKGRVLDVRRMGSVGLDEDGRLERMNAMSDMKGGHEKGITDNIRTR